MLGQAPPTIEGACSRGRFDMVLDLVECLAGLLVPKALFLLGSMEWPGLQSRRKVVMKFSFLMRSGGEHCGPSP